MKIGILGGTFDPPHRGHLALAKAAMEQLGLDEVQFVPAQQNPLKRLSPSASPEDRLRMCLLLIDGYEKFAVSDIEITREGPSYMSETLEELRMTRNAQYWLILGADALASLPKWHQAEEIVKNARLAVSGRDQDEVDAVTRRLDRLYTEAIDRVEMKPVAASSTDIRERLARQESPAAFVPDSVLDYIEAHELYVPASSPDVAYELPG